MQSTILNLKSKISNIPKNPGVYQFLNKGGEIIYIGKAKNLKSRVSQYFSGHDNRPQLPYLMAEAADINYTVVTNKLEAAFLENTLIKQYSPKYNIDLKDDKNYAFITIDYSTEIPQIGYARKIDPQSRIKDKGLRIKYFGPYSAAHKIRNTLNLVRRVFPYCANEKVSSRPCFYYYMHRCPGVCIGKISLDEYKIQLERISEFLGGSTQKIVADIKKEMATAAIGKKFEKAARLRDSLRALEILQEKQNVIMPKKVIWDLVSLAESDGYACVNLFKVREGKLYDKENFVYEIPSFQSNHSERVQPREEPLKKGILRSALDGDTRTIIQRFLEQYYLETSSRPEAVYLQSPAEDTELVGHIIFSRFKKKTSVSIGQKGKTKKLLDLGKLNAEEYLKNWLKDKAGNLDKINAALLGLKEILNLPTIPKRIECYDNSNIQGTNPVGSMVVFENGLPAKSQYRKFKIQGKQTPDDFAMMREMLTRRMTRLQYSPPGTGGVSRGAGRGGRQNKVPPPPAAQGTPPSKEENKGTYWPVPDLIVIDGGKGQLGVASTILHNSKLIIPVIGLAKRIEEIFLPSNPVPIILDQRHPSLQMLQRLRDEAHRFGITFHRSLRSKQAVKSALDTIAGIGPKTKKLLKTKIGTVAEIKKASSDELAKVVGIKLAEIIKKTL